MSLIPAAIATRVAARDWPRAAALCLLQLGVLFYQLLQTEARELYRNLGIFTLSFALVDQTPVSYTHLTLPTIYSV